MTGESPLDDLKAKPLAEAALRALAEQTAEAAAERTAQKVVELIFLHLGVDARDLDQIEKLREDLGFLRRMNRGAAEIKRATIKTCVGALVTGLIAAVGIGLKDHIINLFPK